MRREQTRGRKQAMAPTQTNLEEEVQSTGKVTIHIHVSMSNKISWGTQVQKIPIQNSKLVWWGNTTITNCRQSRGIVRKSHTTIARHQEDKQSKATSSLFPIEMIDTAKLCTIAKVSEIHCILKYIFYGSQVRTCETIYYFSKCPVFV